MARGTQASQILNMLKGEIGNDMDSAVSPGGDSVLYQQIYNQQNWLATEYDWPFLQVRIDLPVTYGVRYYALPTDTEGNQVFELERPIIGECYWSNLWNPTDVGITIYDYNVINPDIGMTLVPIKKWQLYQPPTRTYAPLSAPVTAAGATGLLSGNYTYAVTFVTQWGETEFSPISANLAVINKQISITGIPISGDGNVTGRRIYRTSGTMAGVYYLISTIGNNTTTTATDNLADSALPALSSFSDNTTQQPNFEVWPVPSDSTMKFRLTGQRTLSPFAQPTDRADLDDQLIMLTCAAQFFSMSNPTKSQAASQKAKMRMDRLLSGYIRPNPVFTLDDESWNGRRRDWSNQPTVATMISNSTAGT